jgi:hypothetical protein
VRKGVTVEPSRPDAGEEGGGVRPANGAEARYGGGGRGTAAAGVEALRLCVAHPRDSFPIQRDVDISLAESRENR